MPAPSLPKITKLAIASLAYDLMEGFHTSTPFSFEEWFGVNMPLGLSHLPKIGEQFFDYCCDQLGFISGGIVATRDIPNPNARNTEDPVVSWLRPSFDHRGQTIVNMPQIEIDLKNVRGDKGANLALRNYAQGAKCLGFSCNCVILHEVGHLVRHYHSRYVSSSSAYISFDALEDAEAWWFVATSIGIAVAETAHKATSIRPLSVPPVITPYRAMVNNP